MGTMMWIHSRVPAFYTIDRTHTDRNGSAWHIVVEWTLKRGPEGEGTTEHACRKGTTSHQEKQEMDQYISRKLGVDEHWS